jgi:hypothetical protein
MARPVPARRRRGLDGADARAGDSRRGRYRPRQPRSSAAMSLTRTAAAKTITSGADDMRTPRAKPRRSRAIPRMTTRPARLRGRGRSATGCAGGGVAFVGCGEKGRLGLRFWALQPCSTSARRPTLAAGTAGWTTDASRTPASTAAFPGGVCAPVANLVLKRGEHDALWGAEVLREAVPASRRDLRDGDSGRVAAPDRHRLARPRGRRVPRRGRRSARLRQGRPQCRPRYPLPCRLRPRRRPGRPYGGCCLRPRPSPRWAPRSACGPAVRC